MLNLGPTFVCNCATAFLGVLSWAAPRLSGHPQDLVPHPGVHAKSGAWETVLTQASTERSRTGGAVQLPIMKRSVRIKWSAVLYEPGTPTGSISVLYSGSETVEIPTTYYPTAGLALDGHRLLVAGYTELGQLVVEQWTFGDVRIEASVHASGAVSNSTQAPSRTSVKEVYAGSAQGSDAVKWLWRTASDSQVLMFDEVDRELFQLDLASGTLTRLVSRGTEEGVLGSIPELDAVWTRRKGPYEHADLGYVYWLEAGRGAVDSQTDGFGPEVGNVLFHDANADGILDGAFAVTSALIALHGLDDPDRYPAR
jgi:hypothetical protein